MRIDHLINGQSVAGKDYFETINPATQEVLAEVAAGGEEEVNAAVAAAKACGRRSARCAGFVGRFGLAARARGAMRRRGSRRPSRGRAGCSTMRGAQTQSVRSLP